MSADPTAWDEFDEDDDGVERAVIIEDVDTFAKVPDALNFDTTISHLAVRIYAVLYSHGVNPRRCFPSNERIGRLIGISGRSVARPLMDLMERGWVRRFPRQTKNGLRAANGYALALEPARARYNAERFVKGVEPEPLRRGRIAASALRSADDESDGPSALDSASRPRPGARAVRAQVRGELDQENQTKGTRENARVETSNDGEETRPPNGDRARVELQDDVQAPASPRESQARGRRRRRAATSDSESLFEPADSSADADDCPPNSAGPPRRSGPAGADDPDFVRFWSLVPSYAEHRATRKAAHESWRKARRKLTGGALLAAFETYVAEWATWIEDEWQFIPKATTWLDSERWTEPVKPRRRSLSTVEGGRGPRDTRPRGGAQTDEERREIMRQAAAEITGEPWPPPVEGRVVVESTATHRRRSA